MRFRLCRRCNGVSGVLVAVELAQDVCYICGTWCFNTNLIAPLYDYVSHAGFARAENKCVLGVWFVCSENKLGEAKSTFSLNE